MGQVNFCPFARLYLFWWRKDLLLSSFFLQGVDQQILPCGQCQSFLADDERMSFVRPKNRPLPLSPCLRLALGPVWCLLTSQVLLLVTKCSFAGSVPLPTCSFSVGSIQKNQRTYKKASIIWAVINSKPMLSKIHCAQLHAKSQHYLCVIEHHPAPALLCVTARINLRFYVLDIFVKLKLIHI